MERFSACQAGHPGWVPGKATPIKPFPPCRKYFMQCKRWYCGRILDPSDVRTLAKSCLASRDYATHYEAEIPGASEQCGPEGGPEPSPQLHKHLAWQQTALASEKLRPQCHSCARYQATYEVGVGSESTRIDIQWVLAG